MAGGAPFDGARDAGTIPDDLASTPPIAATPAAPRAKDDVAALAPTTPGEAPSAAPAPEPALPELPAAIGSQRLRDAAMAGDPAAAFEIGARYAEGTGGVQDMRTSVAWYERAANAGLAPAQYRLGSIYEKGLGVPKDLAKAQEWYRRAADAGNVKAMHNLAVLYAEGAGGEPDLEKAAALFRQAAEHGVRDSQFNLAILHARGLGVPEDLIEAYKWFSIAASSGDEESAKRRDIIGAALPEGDLAKAQAAAAAFEPVPLISEGNEVPMPDGGWSDKQDSTSVEALPAEEDAQAGSELSDNDLVALVQKLLTDKGFNPGPADGLLGERTVRAILDFQDQAGLPTTGQVDQELVKALQAASSG
jgi:localization factor PodJL